MAEGDSLELFASTPSRGADPRSPLAERMRPGTLDEVVGQDHLLGDGAPLRALLAAGELPSLVLWGPPGCGKTTLALLLADSPQVRLVRMSAVLAGVKDVREVVRTATGERRAGRRTLLFIDELHRFNRAQQDALLPHVERGTVTLIGATTENPSFEITAPLLSRCRVLTLHALGEDSLAALVRRACDDPERGLRPSGLALDDDALALIARAADGDARRALSLLEAAAALHRRGTARDAPLSAETVRQAVGARLPRYDRDREEHYNVISAFIKSMRASDPDAALYYMARMLAGGEDPRFIARRMVIFASEDVGNAEPRALALATSAYLAVERIGMPEGRIPLAHAVTFLASAPKSNAAFVALSRASAAVEERGSLAVPLHLRNAPTPLLRELGYGRDYRYPHDEPDRFVAEPNLPEEIADARFYEPSDEGAEAAIAERLAALRARRDAARRKR